MGKQVLAQSASGTALRLSPPHIQGKGKQRATKFAAQKGTLAAVRHDSRDDPASKSSKQFEFYYRSQGILESDEWTQFLAACQSTLPTTFRITSSRAASKAVNEHVERIFVPYLSNVMYEGVKQPPPKVLRWYPDHLAWQLDAAKQVIRKSSEFAKSVWGNISRQEAVSMIPPLLLEVMPHHNVLDCCAAPGSKTTQLLEALHAQKLDGIPTSSIPEGLLLANDSDAKRCHMLVHQSLNRIGSPNTMITNLDASAIPSIRMSEQKDGRARHLQFDRILCDVPCSGDGTTRKNPNIWKTWKTADALGLHNLQLRILSRAIQLLKPGGRLVYSTCSYNPIENEAVVSAALDAYPNMTLVDVSDRLNPLKRRPGITTWEVYDKEMNKLSSFENVNLRGTTGKKMKGPARTCWPSGREREHTLERCLRLYPHLQDTGGFFVAVLQKADDPVSDGLQQSEGIKEGSGAANEEDTTTLRQAEQEDHKPGIEEDPSETGIEEASSVLERTSKRSASPTLVRQGNEKRSKSSEVIITTKDAVVKATEGGGRPFNEEPYTFLQSDDEEVKSCIDFFQINDSFPVASLFVRNVEAKANRSIYLTSPVIRDLIKRNDYAKMRLVSCGVKIFTRQDAGSNGVYRCKWRVLQDGLHMMNGYMGPKRKIETNLETLRNMLAEQYPAIETFEDIKFRKDIAALENGSCVCEIAAGQESGGRLESSIILPLWKAPISVCLMVEKTEKRALSLRVFGIDLTQSSKQIQKNKSTRKADSTSDVKEMTAWQEEGQIKIEDNAKASDRASPTGLEDA